MFAQEACDGIARRAGRLVLAPVLVADRPGGAGQGRQPAVGVVNAQVEAEFGPRREHSVGFVGPLGDQVVDQDADIGVCAAEHERVAAAHGAGGVDAGQQSLAGGLLVPRRAVNLAGQVQARNSLGFQAGAQLGGIHRVVLDRVAGPNHLCPLQARHRCHHLFLDIDRHAGGHSVDVDLVRIEALRLQEYLMPPPIRELDDLVLDRGAVARPHALYLTAVERRPAQAVLQDLVGPLVGIGDVALDLLALD